MQARAQFVLFDGFDPLDVVAPFEVFSAGRDALGGGLDVELVTAEGSRTVASGTPGLSLAATGELDPSAPGYVVIPARQGLSMATRTRESRRSRSFCSASQAAKRRPCSAVRSRPLR